MVKERPILFSAPMVRANLDGRKTQTRRIVKSPKKWATRFPICAPNLMKAGHEVWWHGEETERVGVVQDCPYGKPGDRLWVRESMGVSHFGVRYSADDAYVVHWQNETDDARLEWWQNLYDKRADYDANREIGHPSIFMPRWACRIELEIVSVRVERLSDCSEADAIAEGILVGKPMTEVPNSKGDIYHDGITDPIDGWTRDPVEAYRTLWETINGKGSWDANPWVWVVEFKRVDAQAVAA